VRDRQLRWVRPHRSPIGWASARARSKANPFVCRSDVSSLWEPACRRQAPVALPCVVGCLMGCNRCHGSSHIGRSAPGARPAAPMGAATSVAHRVGSCKSAIEGESVRSLQRCFLAVGAGMPATGACQPAQSSRVLDGLQSLPWQLPHRQERAVCATGSSDGCGRIGRPQGGLLHERDRRRIRLFAAAMFPRCGSRHAGDRRLSACAKFSGARWAPVAATVAHGVGSYGSAIDVERIDSKL